MNMTPRAMLTWIAMMIAGLIMVGCGGADEPAEPAQAAAEDMAEAVQEDAETMVDDAQAMADEAVADAADMADDMTASAEDMADDMVAEAEGMVDDAMADAEAMADEVAADVDDMTEEAAAAAAAGAAAVAAVADGSDTEEAAPAASGDAVQVTIGALDLMQYTVREFTVQAGQPVELTLQHQGNLPKQAMGHNVVILQAGADYAEFANRVLGGGGSIDNEYLPEDLRGEAVAFTRMIGGGESDTVTFTAPSEPGEYPFLCTFPAHSGLMNGVMIVE
ncbi:MAG: plastocyanin/azurin family copper-binding protein [Pseudomonadota bacterium]